MTTYEYIVNRGYSNLSPVNTGQGVWADPVAGSNALRDSRLHKKAYHLEIRGTGRISPSEYTDRSDAGGGFDMTTGLLWEAGQRLFVTIQGIDLVNSVSDNIIDSSFFYGQLEIAQITESSVLATVNRYIDTLEQDFLKKLLGYELSKLFQAGYGVNGIYKDLLQGVEYTNRFGNLDKFRGLVFQDGAGNKKRSMIANYIYYYYVRQETTFTSGSGEKQIMSQNAEKATSIMKQVRAWNEMVKWIKELYEFLYVKQSDYPSYFNTERPYATEKHLFQTINSLNL